MRHRKKGTKIGTDVSHRKALVRNLITSLIENEKIETTKTRAKAIQPEVDKLISFVQKHEPVTSIRRINSIVFTEAASKKIMNELKERYKDRKSGFTSIKLSHLRDGDSAPIVTIELVN